MFAQGFCADLQRLTPESLLLDVVPVVNMSLVEAVHDQEASKASPCMQCNEARTTLYKDSNDGNHYCVACWVAFYGRQPAAWRLIK